MHDGTTNKPGFALVGLGFIADRHLNAIDEVGGDLIMACDIDGDKAHKAGKAKFVRRWTDMLQDPDFLRVDYVSICTPNNLHVVMAKTFADAGKKVICEKPVAISSTDLKSLKENDKDISVCVQLRYNPELQRLKEKMAKAFHVADFTMHLHRDSWYWKSWKNDTKQSGGLLFNIGIHYFDLLCWLFGEPEEVVLKHLDEKRGSGEIRFRNARATWSLDISVPLDNQKRYFSVDGTVYNTGKYFETLHTTLFNDVLSGGGVRPSSLKMATTLIEELNGLGR